MKTALVEEARRAVSKETIVETIKVLSDVAAAPGTELRAAENLAAHWESTVLDSVVVVHRDGDSADVEAATAQSEAGAAHLGFYSHLDTSLTGDTIVDAPITGLTGPMPELAVSENQAVGFGLSVARAPTAAALAGIAAASSVLSHHEVPHHISHLVTGGGTHRAYPLGGIVPPPDIATPGFGAGVHRSLRRGYRPDAVVNVKAAAPGVLYEEPGAMFVRMAVRGPMFPSLLRERLAPDGGAIGTGRQLLEAFEDWRETFVAQPASAQCGHEATVGAVRSGSFEKVDLVAAIFEAAAYVMFPPGEDPEAITADLTDAISAQLNEDVEVEVYASVVGGSSPPDATIVTLANEVWDEAHGTGSHVVSGWTGSTDGAIFRNAGIDTVRIGLSTRPGDDPRTDVVALDDVVVSAEMYAEMAVRFATMDAT